MCTAKKIINKIIGTDKVSKNDIGQAGMQRMQTNMAERHGTVLTRQYPKV